MKIFVAKIKYFLIFFIVLPTLCFAYDADPFTKTSNEFMRIFFGPLGTAICCIIMGGMFIMAKTGKVTWDKFLFIGFCAAGFLGTPSIVSMLQHLVN